MDKLRMASHLCFYIGLFTTSKAVSAGNFWVTKQSDGMVCHSVSFCDLGGFTFHRLFPAVPGFSRAESVAMVLAHYGN